jgi:hypothetical protein
VKVIFKIDMRFHLVLARLKILPRLRTPVMSPAETPLLRCCWLGPGSPTVSASRNRSAGTSRSGAGSEQKRPIQASFVSKRLRAGARSKDAPGHLSPSAAAQGARFTEPGSSRSWKAGKIRRLDFESHFQDVRDVMGLRLSQSRRLSK